MNLRNNILLSILTLVVAAVPAFSQVDTLVTQISNSPFESFAGSMSADGRFVVFESKGDIASVNPRNADHNSEIFLFDYAQRRIFQLTNTRSVLYDDSQVAETFANVRVEITNIRPQISADGKWIVFGSNATTSRPGAPDATSPASFNGNAYTSPTPTPTSTPATPTPTPSVTPTPGGNPLTQDGNLEMWIYEIPAYPVVADLSAGDEVPLTDLAGGTFTRLTNTDPEQLPRAGSSNNAPVVADDNHAASISGDGNVIAFVSNRDLVAGGNTFPTADNDEIFTYVRATATMSQVTKTPRGPNAGNPLYNKNPSISGNGLRVAFASNYDNPVQGMTGGNNALPNNNEEIFYADLNGSGAPVLGKQVTVTTPTVVGAIVNVLDPGRRLSRDGRYIAFDSRADLVGTAGNQVGFALFVYDITNSTFRQVGPRSDADSAATGGDVQHYPGFTDYNGSGVPQTLVMESRLNLSASGTIPSDATQGLNNDSTRPTQLYAYSLGLPAATATFTRLTKFPAASSVLGQAQPLPSNTLQRMAFNFAGSELGTGNQDFLSEVYYLLKPTATTEVTPTALNFTTGATHLAIAPSASPTPTPTPTGTPVTPASVVGMAPGMLVSLDYTASDPAITTRTAVGDVTRRPPLPVELSGVTLTINGAAAGLKSVSGKHIDFTVPEGLPSKVDGTTTYPLVLNNNGNIIRTTVTLVPARPDIFRIDNIAAPGGRTKAFNVTNTVPTGEPFAVKTVEIKGGTLVPTVLRVYVTGVDSNPVTAISVRIKGQTIAPVTASTQVEPGVWALDFALPAALEGAGESPVIVTVTVGSTGFVSRVDDTTSFIKIL